MKILVAVKRVVDFNVKIRIKADNSGIETANSKMAMNPFDEIALEEAVRLKEAGHATSIVAVSIGPSQCQEILRAALALGADQAILIQADQELPPLTTAKLLKELAIKEAPDLIILGKQAIDTDNNQVGQMLAALLQWPQGTFVSKVALTGNQVQVVREIDGGLESLVLQLPAVITTDLRLNTPRYASLPNIMRAKQKPLTVLTLDQFTVDRKPRVVTLKISAPPVRKAGIKVQSVNELVTKLRDEAKVI